MENPLYKYRLHELFIAHYGAARKQGKEDFSRQYGWSMGVVEEDCGKLMNSACINRKRLADYSRFFGVPVEELKTKRVEVKLKLIA